MYSFSLSLSLSLARALSLQVTQEANQTQKPPPGRPRLEAHHVHSSLPGYVQLMHDCWAQFPHERPTTDQCVMQVIHTHTHTHTHIVCVCVGVCMCKCTHVFIQNMSRPSLRTFMA